MIVISSLSNNLKILSPSGKIGDILINNEKNWIHPLLTDNPGLFSGFFNQNDTSIVKTMWHGEFPGKLLTGIAQTYLLNNDPETLKVGDKIVEYFSKGQEESGYLGPWPETTRFNRDIPDFKSEAPLGKWDTWGHYHCIYGLYRWYQVTGNKKALKIAIKALDNIYDFFIASNVPIVSQKWAECNLAIGHTFALFYEETKDIRYLETAERIVNNEWPIEYWDFYTKSICSCNWMETALSGKSFYNSRQPRWEGLYALETLAVLYRNTKKEMYAKALNSLWYGMQKSDRHNTGSFGTGEGAVGNPYGAWSETCNTVAWMAFSTDFLKFSKDSKVADELELSFYNAALGSLLSGERNFTYRNDSDGSREPARKVIGEHGYTGALDMSCCQANGNRGLTQLTEWALLSSENSIYLNYYGASKMTASLDNEHDITFLVKSTYPKGSNINIQVLADIDTPVTLNLRIPSWSKSTRILLNGQELNAVLCGNYYPITRNWKEDDLIEIILDMGLHYWVADCDNLKGRTSVYRGPLLLATQDLSASFSKESIETASFLEGDGIINLKVDLKDGKTVILTDYYTAGKTEKPYASWLLCDISPVNSNSVWCPR